MPRLARFPVLMTSVSLIALTVGALGFRTLGVREARSLLEERADAERAAFEAQQTGLDQLRQSFVGELHDGNAWDGYERALALAPSGDVGGVDSLTRGDDALGEGELRGLAAAWAPALERLRSGARSASAATGEAIEWSTPNGRSVLVLKARSLVNAGTLSAELALRDGRDRDAAAQLLDLGRFAMDYRSSAALIDESFGVAFAGIVLEFASAERLDRFDRSALEELEHGLRIWDETFATPSTVGRTELARLSYYVLGADGDELAACANLGECLVAGYSRERAVVDALLAFWEDAEVLAGAATEPWPVRLELFGEREALRQSSGNPVLAEWAGRIGHQMQFERQGREVLARLRLLRIELAWRLRGERLELGDPTWEGTLRFDTAGGAATVCAAAPSFLGEPIERALPVR